MAIDTLERAGRRRRRWLAAGSLVFGLALIGLIPPLIGGVPGSGMRLLFFSIEVPLVVVALSLHYEHAERRNRDLKRTLMASAAIATFVSIISLLTFHTVLRSQGMAFDQRFENMAPIALAAVGAIKGLVECAVWAFAFVFPAAAEDARLRTLEAETHRLEAETLKLEADKLKLEAEKLRAAAELAMLRSQLQPHFLLNTLNAIAGFVTKRPQEARRLLGCLGDLLRDSLRAPTDLQTLDEELTWLQRYAEILESRHGEALRFFWEVADDARRVLVPRLLLQPLVENAVNHGALQRDGGGQVRIRISLDDGAHVLCAVEDNGPGVPDAEPRSGAFGLRSVRRRLELEYHGEGALTLESSPDGTRAVVRLPRSPHLAVAS